MKPTLGPKVCKYYLHWAIWIPRVGLRVGYVESRAWGLGLACEASPEYKVVRVLVLDYVGAF